MRSKFIKTAGKIRDLIVCADSQSSRLVLNDEKKATALFKLFLKRFNLIQKDSLVLKQLAES